ncbi:MULTISPECIES: TetR/AcrR family transcriptional regulator [unclassified Salinibacterium]|uniref:TetR/AcrR family transcriptional regulator n=1 Tax=unclassified Salinibacterium TaxID=2632331 RepID=UPI00142148BE|nr:MULTISPECIES: TetR/AcrR family transcriptional regulator [unclassified Salinibacterium]
MSAVDTAQPEESRLRILKAAAEIAAERGYEGTTISRICERSGLPASSLYWFFTDKDDLLAEVVRHSFREWNAEQPAWEPFPADISVGDGLRRLLHHSSRSLPSAPEFLRIGHMLALERRETEPVGRALFLQVREEVADALARWFAASIDADLIARQPALPHRLATLIIALTDGLFLAYQIADLWDPDTFVDLIVTVVETAIAEAEADL